MKLNTHRVVIAVKQPEGGFRYLLVAKGLENAAALELWDRIDEARREDRLPFDGYVCVRSDNDGDPRWSQAEPLPRRLVNILPGEHVKDEGSFGKRIAPLFGLEGREGGWLYAGNGKPVLQGYANLVRRHRLLGVWVSGKGFVVVRLPKNWLDVASDPANA